MATFCNPLSMSGAGPAGDPPWREPLIIDASLLSVVFVGLSTHNCVGSVGRLAG